MKTHYVYVLYKNNTSNIKYIGVTNNVNRRFKKHYYEAFNERGKEYNLLKSRWIRKHKDIKIRIIFSGAKDECYNKEIYFINMAKNKNKYILNLTDGGDKPKPINELVNFNEICDKIRKKALGRKISEETRLKMSISGKLSNKPHLKLNHKGTENPRSYKVKQCTLLGEPIKIWDYVKLASKELNINYSSICSCVNNKQKTAGGFCWIKIENKYLQ